MTGICVADVARLTGGVLHGDGAAPVAVVTLDSRAVSPGCLFAALRGERADGHAYIGAALDAGAACCLAERVPEGETRPVVVVPDTAAALERLAAAYRARFDIPVLGITGSVGKTTAKEMVAAVLSQRWSVLKTEKNFNNQLGVPLTLFRLEPGHQAAVVEMGVSHFGDMAPLAAMARPTAMLFTVIGRAHLEHLVDRAGVCREKTSVLETMPPEAVAFCNGDDDFLRSLSCKQRKVTFGLSPDCDVRAVDISLRGVEGMDCVLVSGVRRVPVTIPAYGEHMVYAALEGAAVGLEYGLTDAEIRAGIAAYRPVGSRAGILRTPRLTVVDDCYNANPDSVASALRSLRLLGGRRVAILGDMKELGAQEAALHRESGALAARCADAVVACGPLARELAAGARAAGCSDARHFETLEDLLAALPSLVTDGDVVLVKASHSMAFERVVAALRAL